MSRILAVDDEPNHLNAIRRLFLSHSAKLRCVGSGHEAMSVIEEYHPDVLILDINMPGMDGYEVCRRIKSDPDLRGTLVLLLSARTKLEDRLSGYHAEADDFLPKPYEPSELIAKVDVLLRLKAAQDSLAQFNQQLEAEVRRQSRALVRKERQAIIGRMVQGIAHNMRGPLAVIDGNISIAALLLTALAEEKGQDRKAVKVRQDLENCMGQIRVGSQRASQLIRNLIATGGGTEGEVHVLLNLNELIQRETEFLKSGLAARNDIRIRLDLAEDLSAFMGYDTDFAQIVYNMIQNAADAMVGTAQRILTISTCPSDSGGIEMRFTDTGCGIASENIERIFDPFFSTKSADKEKGDGQPTGSGIGLYYCRKIIESYHGSISVQSRIGQGTVFTITLPSS